MRVFTDKMANWCY